MWMKLWVCDSCHQCFAHYFWCCGLFCNSGASVVIRFDTFLMFAVSQVLIAVGRDACTGKIGLDKAGVEVNAKYVYHLNSLFRSSVLSVPPTSHNQVLVVMVSLARAG